MEYYTAMGKALEEEKRKRENETKIAMENGGPDSNKQNGPDSRPPLETDPINNNGGPTKGVPNSTAPKDKRTGKSVSSVASSKNKSDGVKPGVKAK